MNILSIDSLSKAYGDKVLFEELSFGMMEGEKVAIIGKNGSGKSTLLKIIAGEDYSDDGKCVVRTSAKMIYLPQEPLINPEQTPMEYVISAKSELVEALDDYELISKAFSKEYDEEKKSDLKSRLGKLQDYIDSQDGWNIRQKAEKYLDKLGVDLPNSPVATFSGGERKRVAIAKALIAEPDFLLLDEPTNHLDVDTVQWLQDVISGFKMTILFITHDRYFLDSVATRILELDEGVATSFPGNYEAYLTKKAEMQRVEAATLDAKQKKLKTELEWLKRGAKARRTKAKSRIDDISILKEETVRRREEGLDIRPGATYLGGTILEAHNLVKEFGGRKLIDKFNYVAQPNQRIGIIGKNGSGKSTLLNMLAGELEPDSGYVTIGQTAVVGFFRQQVRGIDMERTVVDNVKMIADHFKYGYKHEERVTAEDLLDRFMFSRKMQRSKASVLSGGELKRLALLRVLIKNPNVLFMDEPTNDFDLQTLAALEDYLDLFEGVLITISHDRAFLDRCIEFVWSFEGDIIKEYPGNYSSYLDKKEERRQESADKQSDSTSNDKAPKQKKSDPPAKRKKLSYKEQREYDGLMEKIENLEAKRSGLRAELADLDPVQYEKYGEIADSIQEIGDELDGLEMRWLELSEIVDG
jgi:ATP-binding cassette subfamily F protein uup